MTHPPTCREIAAAIAEPLAGTAPTSASRWLLIEHRPAWGSHVVNDIMPAPIRQQLRVHGITPIAVRASSDRQEDGPCGLWLSQANGTLAHWLATDSDTRDQHVQQVAESGVAPAAAVVSGEPMLLVCTNGKRDACCAVKGRAIVDGVQPHHRPRIWECSHLGGHRFAGVTLLLPWNYISQCTSAADADAVLDHAQVGLLQPVGLRGRTGIPAAHQAAEIAAREIWQQWRLDSTVAITDQADHVVATDDHGNALLIDIETGQGPARPESCTGDAKPLHWVRAHARTSR